METILPCQACLASRTAETEGVCFSCLVFFFFFFVLPVAGARFLLNERITRIEKIDKTDGNGGEICVAVGGPLLLLLSLC